MISQWQYFKRVLMIVLFAVSFNVLLNFLPLVFYPSMPEPDIPLTCEFYPYCTEEEYGKTPEWKRWYKATSGRFDNVLNFQWKTIGFISLITLLLGGTIITIKDKRYVSIPIALVAAIQVFLFSAISDLFSYEASPMKAFLVSLLSLIVVLFALFWMYRSSRKIEFILKKWEQV